MSRFQCILWLLVLSLLFTETHAQLPPGDSREFLRLPLEADWEFSSADSGIWRRASVPGCNFTDLQMNGVIADPLIGTNEEKCQWVGERDWVYRTSEFDLPKELQGRNQLFLRFNGLDTYATVILNDEVILVANNAFRSWEVDVKKIIKKRNNRIIIRFANPLKAGEKHLKSLPYPLPGDGVRAVSRKPQFHYGWDFGPKLLLSGITDEIEWLAWDIARFSNVYIRQDKVTEKEAILTAVFEIRVDKNDPCSLFFHIPQLADTYHTKLTLKKGMNLVELPLRIPFPKLWWCNGQGDPFLYTMHAWMTSGERLLDKHVLKKGIRQLDLVTRKDSIGETFQFELNGLPVYAKGANMVPLSYFPAQKTQEDYRELLTMCRNANFNMLRVWGGGVYENDEFYKLCDEMGIMVWQDFMFAGSMYPADSLFVVNIIEEANEQTRRLRNHACMALWCGNNETSEGWERWGWQYGLSDKDRTRIKRAYDDVFLRTLAPIVKKNTGSRYWESSPRYGRGDPRSMKEGDCHYWGVWHDELPLETYSSTIPRFMSEFGIQSYPSMRVMKMICGGDAPDPNHPGLRTHQKHVRGFKLMKDYVRSWYPPVDEKDLRSYAQLTQAMQAEAICLGVEAQRRSAPRCMGSLYWQLNDVWPAFSWSSIDYAGVPKLLFTMVGESFAPKLISYEVKNNNLKVYFINDLSRPDSETLDMYLAVRTWDGKEVYSYSSADNKLSNGISLLHEKDFGDLAITDLRDHVIIVELRDLSSQIQYRRYGKLLPQSNLFFVPHESNGKTYPSVMHFDP